MIFDTCLIKATFCCYNRINRFYPTFDIMLFKISFVLKRISSYSYVLFYPIFLFLLHCSFSLKSRVIFILNFSVTLQFRFKSSPPYFHPSFIHAGIFLLKKRTFRNVYNTQHSHFF